MANSYCLSGVSFGRIVSSAWKVSVTIVAVVSIDFVFWIVSFVELSLYDIEPKSCGSELPGKASSSFLTFFVLSGLKI